MREEAFILFGGFTRSLYHQFIPTLGKMGFRVLIIDLPGSERYRNNAGFDPGRSEIFYSDGNDLASILWKCRQWRELFAIKGALNTIEEFTLSSAIAIDYLQLRGPGMKACTIASNKILQRAYFEPWSPPYSYISKGGLIPKNIGYPAIIKATNRHGGQGVVLVRDKDSAVAALMDFDERDQLNFEAYIEGADFSIEAIVRDGKPAFENLTEEDNLFADGHHLEMGYNIPALRMSPAKIEEAYSVNRQILESMGFLNGIAHAEYRVTAEGDIYLMEIAARPPGDGIFSMYQLATGKLIEEAILLTVMGHQADYPKPVRYTQQIYLRHTPGILTKVRFPESAIEVNCFPESKIYQREYRFDPSLPATVREIVLEHKEGDELGKMTGPEARLGWVMLDAPNPDDLSGCALRFLRPIEVVTIN